MRFEGKSALVTGASSGIGRAVALDLSKEGCNVVLVGRNKERLAEAKSAVFSSGVKTLAAVCDVSVYKNVSDMAKIVLKEWGKVDILVNCAGWGAHGPFEEAAMEDIDGMMKTNYFGTVYCVKELLPAMLRQGYGHIVNVASMAGKLAFPNYAAYCASKFAVVGFSESLYHELRPKGVKVHLICPAGTQTRFFDHPSFEGHPHRANYEAMLTPERVSGKILEAIEKDVFEVHVPWTESLIVKVKHLAPGPFRRAQHKRHLERVAKRGGKAGGKKVRVVRED